MEKSLNALLNPIEQLPATQQLLNFVRLGQAEAERHGLGLPRAARLPLLAVLQRTIQKPILLLTNRADRALALFDELSFWLPNEHRLYFPEPNPLFYERLPWSESTRRDRLQTLSELSNWLLPGNTPPDKSPVIVAPVRAIMTRTVPRREFLRRALRLKLNETHSLAECARKLVLMGYQHNSIVVLQGQFSRRGGILDLWPYDEPLPLRIEFFGDEIDSIKTFDPAKQRTLEKQNQIVAFPASEALSLQTPASGEMPFQPSEADIASLYSFPSTLIDYLPDGSLILLDGEDFIAATATDIEEESLKRRQVYVEEQSLPADGSVPYLTWSEISDSLNNFPMIELGHTNAQGGSSLAANFDPGPRFAGMLKDFQKHLEFLEANQQPWTVVSRQAARLQQLWLETHPQNDETEQHFLEASLSGGYVLHLDAHTSQHLLSDAEIFGWARPQARRQPRLTGNAPETFYADLRPGDWVVHIDHGIGQFLGLHRPPAGKLQREYLSLQYQNNDILYVPIHQADRVSRYVGPDSTPPTSNRLGGQEWQSSKQKVKGAVAEVAGELLQLYAQRQMAKGFHYAPDNEWQAELEASFPYIETPDQLSAIRAVKADMMSDRPMDRLLCGDVGYGKTEVALRAAFKAVTDGKQVAVLVPTTILAQQHYETFRNRLTAYPVSVEMLSRFRSPHEQDEIIRKIRNKGIDIVIGTHRLISSDVQFADLGLVIIDEEQRFGVAAKEHLKKLRSEVDVLTLTATPIPRTLYAALSGVRDISTINSPPEERLPIITHVGPYDQRLVREAIIRELDRGGQVYFVHNRVQSIHAMQNHLQNLIPEARIGVGHGQLPEDALASVMQQFTTGQIDVLLCTSIIESGLDIPNANTLIIDRADLFGLAQLYQLRGRVGRGAQRAYAYLFRDNRRPPSVEGEERLEVMADNSQLGAGYAIAMRDLEMRGAGDLLGLRQSGFIASVGFHLYTSLLGQAVRALRKANNDLPDEDSQLPWAENCPSLTVNIDLPLDSEIPPSYVPDQDLRLKLYRRISALRKTEEIASTEIEFADRFGPPPVGVLSLFYQMKLKILGEDIGLESISFVNGQIVLQYPPLPEGVKERPLAFIDAKARIGRNAYWLQINPEMPDWQDKLLQILKTLKDQ